MCYHADKQVIDTHTLTDTQTGAMTIPEDQNWPRVKILYIGSYHTYHIAYISGETGQTQAHISIIATSYKRVVFQIIGNWLPFYRF